MSRRSLAGTRSFRYCHIQCGWLSLLHFALMVANPSVSIALALSSPSTTITSAATTTCTPITATRMVTWLIDGNNLKCCRGVPNDRMDIAKELESIASPRTLNWPTSQPEEETTLAAKQEAKKAEIVLTNVVLVFDGDLDESFSKSNLPSKWFQVVITDGHNGEKDRADNYIINEALLELQQLGSRVYLITADKDLGKRAANSGKMGKGGIVYPPKFWKQYLPNLRQKQQQQEHDKYHSTI